MYIIYLLQRYFYFLTLKNLSTNKDNENVINLMLSNKIFISLVSSS